MAFATAIRSNKVSTEPTFFVDAAIIHLQTQKRALHWTL